MFRIWIMMMMNGQTWKNILISLVCVGGWLVNLLPLSSSSPSEFFSFWIKILNFKEFFLFQICRIDVDFGNVGDEQVETSTRKTRPPTKMIMKNHINQVPVCFENIFFRSSSSSSLIGSSKYNWVFVFHHCPHTHTHIPAWFFCINICLFVVVLDLAIQLVIQIQSVNQPPSPKTNTTKNSNWSGHAQIIQCSVWWWWW